MRYMLDGAVAPSVVRSLFSALIRSLDVIAPGYPFHVPHTPFRHDLLARVVPCGPSPLTTAICRHVYLGLHIIISFAIVADLLHSSLPHLFIYYQCAAIFYELLTFLYGHALHRCVGLESRVIQAF